MSVLAFGEIRKNRGIPKKKKIENRPFPLKDNMDLKFI